VFSLRRIGTAAALLFAGVLLWIGWRSFEQSGWMTLLVGGPRLDIPWDASRKDQEASAEIEVPRPAYYSLSLDLHFNRDDPGDRARVHAIAGDVSYGRDGTVRDTGLSIPVRVSIVRLARSTEDPLFDHEVSGQFLTGWTADFYEREITGLRLERGRYRVTVKALSDTPALEGTETHFDMHITHFK
jgi:hypothetical protein